MLNPVLRWDWVVSVLGTLSAYGARPLRLIYGYAQGTDQAGLDTGVHRVWRSTRRLGLEIP